MSARPTPEQIEADLWLGGPGEAPTSTELLEALARNGYVIVHPDDVPTAQFASSDFQRGYYYLHDHIFAAEEPTP